MVIATPAPMYVQDVENVKYTWCVDPQTVRGPEGSRLILGPPDVGVLFPVSKVFIGPFMVSGGVKSRGYVNIPPSSSLKSESQRSRLANHQDVVGKKPFCDIKVLVPMTTLSLWGFPPLTETA